MSAYYMFMMQHMQGLLRSPCILPALAFVARHNLSNDALSCILQHPSAPSLGVAAPQHLRVMHLDCANMQRVDNTLINNDDIQVPMRS